MKGAENRQKVGWLAKERAKNGKEGERQLQEYSSHDTWWCCRFYCRVLCGSFTAPLMVIKLLQFTAPFVVVKKQRAKNGFRSPR